MRISRSFSMTVFLRNIGFLLAACGFFFWPERAVVLGDEEANPTYHSEGRYYEVLGGCRPVITQFGGDGIRKHLVRIDHAAIDGGRIGVTVFAETELEIKTLSGNEDPVVLSPGIPWCIEIEGFGEDPELDVVINGETVFEGLDFLGEYNSESEASHVFLAGVDVVDGVSFVVIQYKGILTFFRVIDPDGGHTVNNCNVVITPPGGGSGDGVSLASLVSLRVDEENSSDCPATDLILFDYTMEGGSLEVELLSDVDLHIGTNQQGITGGVRYFMNFTVEEIPDGEVPTIRGTIRELGCSIEQELGLFQGLGNFNAEFGDAPALVVVPETVSTGNPPFGKKRARLLIEWRGATFGCSFERCTKGTEKHSSTGPRTL